MRGLARALLAASLGVAAAVLCACGSSSSSKLIPVANAEPLKRDFQEVLEAARHGGGSCTSTEEALTKTERDFAALPGAVDSGLRSRLQTGIGNLRDVALAVCSQPLTQTTTTSSTPRTTSTPTTTTQSTTPPPTTTTPTTSTPSTTPTTPTTTTPGGGTPAPKEGEAPPSGANGGAGAGGEAGGAGQEGGR